MQILDKDIIKFQALYLKRFDTELSEDRARDELELLVEQVRIVYRPITQRQLDTVKEHEDENEEEDNDDNLA